MNETEREQLFEIHQTKARYFRCVDTKDWDGLRALVTDDMIFHYDEHSPVPTDGPPRTVGGDAFVEWCSNSLCRAVSVHHGHTPEVEHLGPTTAKVIWAMNDYVEQVDKGVAFQGFGHYHEHYAKGDDGTWRISATRVTRLRINPMPLSIAIESRTWLPPWSADSARRER